MQFEVYREKKTLTLRWHRKPLIMTVPTKWQRDLAEYLWSDESALAMTETMHSVLESHSEHWVRRLAGKAKKKFRLQLQTTLGSENRKGAKSKSLVVNHEPGHSTHIH
jgi:hypothetical protein